MIRLLAAIVCMLYSWQAAAACVGPTSNVIACGGVGDAKASAAVSTTSGSGVITCANCAFAVGDVGKVAWCINPDSGAAVIAQTTITVYTSATQVTLGANANATLTTTGRCVWGTQVDDTALLAALAAVQSTDTLGIGYATLLGPAGVVDACSAAGGWIVSSTFFQHLGTGPIPILKGCNQNSTVFFPTPTATLPLIILVGSNGGIRDFTISCMSRTYTGPADVVRLIQNGGSFVENVSIRDCGVTNSASAILKLDNVNTGRFNNIAVQNKGFGSAAAAMIVTDSGGLTFTAALLSNHNLNLVISGANRGPSSNTLNFFGGVVDECVGGTSIGCTKIVNSKVNVFGTTFYGPAYTAYPAISVDGTSTLYLSDVSAGIYYSTGTGAALDIASGGIVKATGSTLRGNGTGGRAVINAGTFIDGGRNNYQHCSNGDCTAKTAAQAFSGRMPVRQ